MKTEMMLLIQTDGRPVLGIGDIAKLLSVSIRSVQNKIYKAALPFPTFKLADSGEWVAHVSDVAAYIDKERDTAAKELEKVFEH